jgi:hypothetical protein
MRRDLERRLKAVEARRFVSARVAAILRAFHGGFDVEARAQTPAEFTGIFDPRTLTDPSSRWLGRFWPIAGRQAVDLMRYRGVDGPEAVLTPRHTT